MNIAAIVVTYNRKQLLIECIQAILKQSLKVGEIIIIDNNSNDGTYEALQQNKLLNLENIKYKKLDENIGGAGGFYEGFKESKKYNPDWLWIMDDDTIPNEDCLEKLLLAKSEIKEDISFLASSVYGINGEYMNVPTIDLTPTKNGYSDWYKYLNKKMVKIESATFVSILINYKAVKRVGLPCKQYFLWGDDTEYTLRLTKYYGEAYLVGDSVAIHKRKNAKALTIIEENEKNRINIYFYMIRNNLINAKEYKGKKRVLQILLNNFKNLIIIPFKKGCKYKMLKIKVIFKGIISFVFRRYDYKDFRNRMIYE